MREKKRDLGLITKWVRGWGADQGDNLVGSRGLGDSGLWTLWKLQGPKGPKPPPKAECREQPRDPWRIPVQTQMHSVRAGAGVFLDFIRHFLVMGAFRF
jgi:hypothetical protein